MGIRSAPKGDRFYAPEMAIRKYALGMPASSEDFPWGHRAFRVNKKVFLFLAWDDGVFSLTAKLPKSQPMALMLPFAELTGYGMGKSGWVTARFSGRDAVPVGLLCQWTDESYRAIAPKKLAALMLA
jgi:predicted DNA-binding protein (MmcQ/YjbR family)